VALLLHDANCPHCRKALPELDLVAKALTKEAVPWRMAGDGGKKGSFKG
jgi:thiol-disulfide isomerase/thioredoxin